MKEVIIVVIMISLIVMPTACANNSETSATTHKPTFAGGEMELIPPGEMITYHLDVAPGTPGAASDDIVTPPGGYTYRVKVLELDKPEWPPVDEIEISIDALGGTIRCQYREYIETKAGEIRNNILYLFGDEAPDLADPLDIEYYVGGLSGGISIMLGSKNYGGAAGHNIQSIKAVFQIDIASQVGMGEYTFFIILVYKGEEITTLPCTVSVIE